MMRPLWTFFGLAFVVIGAIGLFLPFLPTVPFMLAAAFCFSQSSPRLHNWLLTHNIFGPPIHAWSERGAIPRRVKWISTLSSLAAPVISAILGFSSAVIAFQVICVIAVMAFIWTRPD